MVDSSLVKKLAPILEALSHLSLSERVVQFIRQVKAQGAGDVFAKRVYYVAPSDNASAAAPVYSLQLVDSDGILLIDEIQSPGTGALLIGAQVNGERYVDASTLADFLFDDETSEDPRPFPWPIVCGARDNLQLSFTGAALNTVGLTVRGWHVDELTANVFREVGELFMHGINETVAAAVLMVTSGATNSGTFQRGQQEITHLVGKETLGATVVRDKVDLQLKKDKLIPGTDARGKVFPPLSVRHPGARLSVAVRTGDEFQFQARYTGDGAGGHTAQVQLAMIGRRRYREC